MKEGRRGNSEKGAGGEKTEITKRGKGTRTRRKSLSKGGKEPTGLRVIGEKKTRKPLK